MKTQCRIFFITGTLLIWLIKFGIRPWIHIPNYSVTGFLLGIAPNLVGSFLIPFAAVCLFEGKNHLVARLFSLHSDLELLFVCLFGFALVVINEYLQLYPFFGRTFDYYDILFSMIGTAASFPVFRSLARFDAGVYPSPRKKFIPSFR